MSTDHSAPEQDANLSALGRELLGTDGSKPASGPWVPPTAEELGKLLPDYEIVKMLGRGGMGAVYMGRQKSLDRPVAIKILSNDLETADASFAERFKNEARAMAKLSHPGIVGVHDFGETASGLLYIVMEFIEGTDVAKMIAKQGRLHTEHAMAITAHVCDALAYAHERGIIHRDIKPANIMVGYDGVVKVADFGLAKMTHSNASGLTQSGMAMGTLHYMAPEALMLGSAVDHRADIYAVGVMLYQMLTGKLPQGMFKLPSLQIAGLDPRYDAIIAKAIMEDREQRYQTVKGMRGDLDGILTQPVVKVEENAPQASAALPTMARPQRPGAGQPYRPPHQTVIVRTEKKGSALLWLTTGMATMAAWVYFKKPVPLGVSWSTPAVPAAPSAPAVKAPSVATIANPAEATKERPFVNLLGMKFVPVPGTKVLMCVHETRKGDYRAFAAANPGMDKSWEHNSWGDVEISPSDDHPVVAVSWQDCQLFCKWLSERTTIKHRLPTDREWSFAVGIADREDPTKSPSELNHLIEDAWPWGNVFPPASPLANLADESLLRKSAGRRCIEGYRDGFITTAPVMSFPANALGIHDLSGNVWEWLEDKFSKDGPLDRTFRGGDFLVYTSLWATSSHRSPRDADRHRGNTLGFRVVIELPASATSLPAPNPVSPSPSRPVSSSPSSATKEEPFVNSLGMRLVPVPILDGPTTGKRLFFSIWETRVQDYAAFAAETPRLDSAWKTPQWHEILLPGELDHPVACVAWENAVAFCRWLTAREQEKALISKNMRYRLPTDLEWSSTVGLRGEGDGTPRERDGKLPGYPWGDSWPPPQGTGNFADLAAKARSVNVTALIAGYHDGFATTSPVGSFPANASGLFDLTGNVWEMCEDWIISPAMGDPHRTIRGGAFNVGRPDLYSSARSGVRPKQPHGHVGFRVVLELP